MNLVLDKKYEDSFYLWLVEKIKKLFPLFIKKHKLIKLSQYLDIDCYLVLIEASRHLVVKDFRDNKIITVDDSARYGKHNLKELCKIINDGNMEVKGCGIFTQIFSMVKKNLEVYYFLYRKRV